MKLNFLKKLFFTKDPIVIKLHFVLKITLKLFGVIVIEHLTIKIDFIILRNSVGYILRCFGQGYQKHCHSKDFRFSIYIQIEQIYGSGFRDAKGVPTSPFPHWVVKYSKTLGLLNQSKSK